VGGGEQHRTAPLVWRTAATRLRFYRDELAPFAALRRELQMQPGLRYQRWFYAGSCAHGRRALLGEKNYKKKGGEEKRRGGCSTGALQFFWLVPSPRRTRFGSLYAKISLTVRATLLVPDVSRTFC